MRSVIRQLIRGDLSPSRWLTELMDSADDLWDPFELDDASDEGTGARHALGARPSIP